jgi:hypothetical protein
MKSIDIRSESAVKLLAEFLDMDSPYVPGARHTNAEHFAHGMSHARGVSGYLNVILKNCIHTSGHLIVIFISMTMSLRCDFFLFFHIDRSLMRS